MNNTNNSIDINSDRNNISNKNDNFDYYKNE